MKQVPLGIMLTVWSATSARAYDACTLSNLSKEAYKLSSYQQAYDYAQQAYTLDPENALYAFDLGICSIKSGHFDQAITVFQRLVNVNPHNITLHYNLAYAYKLTEQLDKARDLYIRIIAQEPDHAMAHMGLAQTYLLQGDFEQGFVHLKWRSPNLEKYQRHTIYSYLVRNKRVLIKCEWGFGDIFHFIRYAELLHEQGAYVIVQTYEPLVTLLQTSFRGISEVIPFGAPVPPVDIALTLLDLPLFFKTTFKTIPACIPYAFASGTSAPLPHLSSSKLNIGICWKGRGEVHAPASHQKNVPLTSLLAITAHPHVILHVLHPYAELTPDEMSVINSSWRDQLWLPSASFDTQHGAFMDTIELMQKLDLIITIDTSLAHLAGALGKPVWVLLPYYADWRWLQHRNDSPWYPTMKLFRQSEPGNWTMVIKEVEEKLFSFTLH